MQNPKAFTRKKAGAKNKTKKSDVKTEISSTTDNTIYKLRVSAKKKEKARSKLITTAEKLAITAKEAESVRRKLAVTAKEKETVRNKLVTTAEKLAVTAKEAEIVRRKLAVTAREKETVRNKLVTTAEKLAVTAKEAESVRRKLAVTAREKETVRNKLVTTAEKLAVTAKEAESVRRKLAVTAREKETVRNKLVTTAEKLAVTAKEAESVRRKLAVTAKEAESVRRKLAIIAKEKETVRNKLVTTAEKLAITAKEAESVRRKLAVTAKEKETVRNKLVTTAKKLAVIAKKTELINKELRTLDIAKDEFVSIASHQLRTPLTAIKGYAGMLLDGDAGPINKKQHEYLVEIKNANERMIGLITALLNVSRVDLDVFIVEPEQINLKIVAENVLKDLNMKIESKRLKIKTTYKDNIPLINADLNIVQMIFQNLLTNAVKYTQTKGKINFDIKQDSSNILISVADTGYGIPSNVQSKIFTKMFRADNARIKDPDGTGLGLYIIKSTLEKTGGKIWFKSVENKGSTFYVTIPLDGMKKKKGTKRLELK